MSAHASALLVIDLSTILVWIGTVAGETTCVIPAAAHTDARIRAGIRAYMRAHDIDCSACPLACPMSPLAHGTA